MSKNKKNSLTVIIPTLNESDNIEDLLCHLKCNATDKLAEIIVCDAESTDGTAKLAAASGAHVIDCKQASRAHQMNEGAKEATGDILYFVHADAKPPHTYLHDITSMVEKKVDFGCYRFKFDSTNPLLAINSFFTRFKLLWCRGGDQTLFIRKSVFDQNNGFDEDFVVMEDFELIRRLWKKYKFEIMAKSVLVSARKYEYNSYWNVNLANFKIFRMFMKGYPPQLLKEKYHQLIQHPTEVNSSKNDSNL